jgi:hypothetical protein
VKRKRLDRLYLLILICDGRIGGADQAMLPLGFFATSDLAGLKTGARHTGIGLFPAWTRSSGNAARPQRQIPLRRSQFATNGEVRRDSSSGRGRFARQEFSQAAVRSPKPQRSSSRDGSMTAPRRFGASRLVASGNRACRRLAPRSARQMYLIQNNVMKQWLTEKAGSRLPVVCATHLQKRLRR